VCKCYNSLIRSWTSFIFWFDVYYRFEQTVFSLFLVFRSQIMLLLVLIEFVFSFGCAGLFVILGAFFHIVWKFCIQVILYNILCAIVVLIHALIPERSLLCTFCLFIPFRLCLLLYGSCWS